METGHSSQHHRQGLGLVFVFASIFLVCQFALAEDREVRIGFVLPLSGDWAFLGEGVRNAATLAAEELKGSTFPPRLIFEDNAGQLKNSATAAQRLISIEKVDAIVSIISGVGLLISSIAEKAEVLNFGICSNTEVANGSYSFTNYITTPEGAKAFLQELTKRYPRPVRLGIFSMNEEGFNQIAEQVRLQSSVESVDIQFVETYQPETKDFRSQILKVFKNDPQVLLLLGLSPGLEILRKQLRDLRHDLPIASIEAFGLAEHKEVFNGAWFIDAAAASMEFQTLYKKRFGRELTAAAAHAHDTVSLLVEAFQQASKNERKPSHAEVVSFLHTKEKFHGVVGDLHVDEAGIIHSVPSVKTMVDGRGVVQGEQP